VEGGNEESVCGPTVPVLLSYTNIKWRLFERLKRHKDISPLTLSPSHYSTMSTSHTMIIVHCWVDPKNALEFEGHLRKAYESTIAEPECLYFEIMTNPSSPGEYIFTEGWSLTKEEFLIVRFLLCDCSQQD